MNTSILKLMKHVQLGEDPFRSSNRKIYQPLGGRLKRYKKVAHPDAIGKVKEGMGRRET